MAINGYTVKEAAVAPHIFFVLSFRMSSKRVRNDTSFGWNFCNTQNIVAFDGQTDQLFQELDNTKSSVLRPDGLGIYSAEMNLEKHWI